MTMKISKAILGVSLAALPFASAQFTDPPIKDRAKLIKQAGQLFQALEPVVAQILTLALIALGYWRNKRKGTQVRTLHAETG